MENEALNPLGPRDDVGRAIEVRNEGRDDALSIEDRQELLSIAALFVPVDMGVFEEPVTTGSPREAGFQLPLGNVMLIVLDSLQGEQARTPPRPTHGGDSISGSGGQPRRPPPASERRSGGA